MKRVFIDMHHSDLFFSLVLLFERRFGWEVYRPIGLDWWENDFWHIAKPYNDAPDTINQYLGINDKSWDAYKNLNGNYKLEDDVYKCYDPVHDYHHKAITLEKFKTMKFDYIISSIPAHDYSFAELRNKYQPEAIHIAQIGNVGQSTHIPYVLCAAATLTDLRPDQKVVYYHQEFDLSTFTMVSDYTPNTIRCLMNGLPFTPDYPVYQRFKERMSDWDFKSYGGSCDDGSLHNIKDIAKAIQDSQFIWQLKHTGDGFGHVIHNAAACGKPLIVKKEYYRGQLAEPLLEDGVTCITVDGKSDEQVEQEIRHYAQRPHYIKMSKAMRERFNAVVDYEAEAREIKRFFEGLSN